MLEESAAHLRPERHGSLWSVAEAENPKRELGAFGVLVGGKWCKYQSGALTCSRPGSCLLEGNGTLLTNFQESHEIKRSWLCFKIAEPRGTPLIGGLPV